MQTSTTLLRSLQANRLGRAWFRMVDVYGPMVRGWLRRQRTEDRPDVWPIHAEVADPALIFQHQQILEQIDTIKDKFPELLSEGT